jgi:hypothetical protein
MKPTLKALEERIANHARTFGSNNYHLIENLYHEDIVYLVDVEAPYFMSMFTHVDLKFLCKGFEGHYGFEVIHVVSSEAAQCNCKEGDYLCIVFTL